MARLAWVTMTRVTADRQQPVTPEPRVDAGVKELNEMTIGRTDDPENPLGAKACEAASVFGTGSRTPSGPAVMAPRRQAGHMIAIDPPVRILVSSLASKGPSTHAPTRPRGRPHMHPRGRPHMQQGRGGAPAVTKSRASNRRTESSRLAA